MGIGWTTQLAVDSWFASVICTVLTRTPRIVDVRENTLRTCAGLDDVVSFFATTVAETVGDPSFWSCAAMMGGVVFYMSHDWFSFTRW
jgi:hypothetical protein